MSRVLITGGAGFIGSHLTRHLIAEGLSLRVLDPLAPQVHGALPNGLDWLRDKGVEFIRGTVTDRRDVEKAIRDITHIVHLAAETGTGQSMYEVAKYNEVNSQGTAVLLDVLANTTNHSVERILLASSRSVYGEGAYTCECCAGGDVRVFPGLRTVEQLQYRQWEPLCSSCRNPLVPVATREFDRVQPVSVYAATKYAQEELVRVVCESLNIDYVVLRLQNVYGEGQSLINPYTGILSIFSTRVRQGLELPVFEDGRESRDFVHVNDVVRAMGLVLTWGREIRQVVNVGSGVATSMIDVADKLSKAFNSARKIKITAEYRVGDIRHNFADLSKLKSMFGYEPLVTLDEGLQRFATWVLTQPLPENLLDKANSELRARKLMG